MRHGIFAACTFAMAATSIVAGCGVNNGALRNRAVHDLGCPREEIQVIDLGAGGRRVEGCGRAQEYTCMSTARHETVCEPTGFTGPSSAYTAPTGTFAPAPTTWGDGQVLDALENTRIAVLACVPATTLTLALAVDITPEGRIGTVALTGLSASEQSCVASALGTIDLPGSVGAGRHVDFTAHRASDDSASAGGEELTAATATAGRVRALLDARATRILACVGAPSAAMVVSWTLEGRLDVSVRGAGAAENLCVEATLEDATLAPPPTAIGSVLHALAR